MKAAILAAAKATAIPAGSAGQWVIRKLSTTLPVMVPRDDKIVTIPPGEYTYLSRYTLEAIGKLLNSDGTKDFTEVVMEDTPFELNTHLEFMLHAHGNVLITGLGLGCVVRGTLANPAVTHVTVIERDADVLKLVQPYMPKDRLTIVVADAREWIKTMDEKFDCCWHDLWSDPDLKEKELQRTHMDLILELHEKIPMQGAWSFPRIFRRRMKEFGVI